tara:strand:+ start:53 stop:583 length:531 start_codon:yes stop_codon:yes gene_type:complete
MKLPKVPDYFSRQAQVAMLGYVVLAVAILLPVNLEKEEYNLTERVVSLLMMVLPMVVSVYTINCLVRGSSKGGLPCDVLAWLNSGSILVWSVLVLVLTLLLYANGGNEVNGVEAFRDRLWWQFWKPRPKPTPKPVEKPKSEAKPVEKPKSEVKPEPELRPPAPPTGAAPVSGPAPV